jgi:hypothetical protein
VALSALRIAGTIFLIINLLAGVYFFGNRCLFFEKDPNIPQNVPAAREFRLELILIPWLALTTYLVVVLIQLWRD